jgi:hypothetical protein
MGLDLAMKSLGIYGQTWRSIVSFFLRFCARLMVWFTPEWVTGFVETAGSVKYLSPRRDRDARYGQPSAFCADSRRYGDRTTL